MGLLTDFYAANRNDAAAILRGNSSADTQPVRLKNVDPVKLESLQRSLAVELGTDVGSSETELLAGGDGEQWVLLLPNRLVMMLAQSASVRSPVAERWAETDELRADGWTSSTATEVLAALFEVAAKAHSLHLDVLLRMSL